MNFTHLYIIIVHELTHEVKFVVYMFVLLVGPWLLCLRYGTIVHPWSGKWPASWPSAGHGRCEDHRHRRSSTMSKVVKILHMH
jgi:hypothetical protein